jgi:drug/metabolite transporter (DMT)-like permease
MSMATWPRLALVLFAASSLAWVVLEEVLGSMLEQPYPLMQIVWCRYASHLALLLAICAWREPRRLWCTRRLPFHLLRSMLMLAMPLSFVASVHAGAHTGMTWSLFWMAPLLVLAIEYRSGREPVEQRAAARTGWVSAGCTLAAAMMLLPRQWPPISLWPVAAVGMALSLAAYIVMTRSLRNEAIQANLFYTALGVFIVLTPLMPSIWVMPTAHDALVLFGIGAAGLALLFAIDRAASAAPLSLSVPGLYAYLPLLGFFGWFLHGSLSLRSAVGAISVAAAIAYLWHRLPSTNPGRALSR